MSGEHWFDRLADPHTRRQGFKAALAGVALTLPFQRSRAAFADNPGGSSPDACKKGCLYTQQRKTQNYLRTKCDPGKASDIAKSGFAGIFGKGIEFLAKSAVIDKCVDRALLLEKAGSYDCLQPNCPGFDPYGEFGPCEACAAVEGCACCPSQTSSIGYDYCTSPPYCCGTAPGGGGCVPCGG